MIDAVALAALLNATSISAPLRPLQRLTVVTTATSETPLPEALTVRSVLQTLTQGVAVPRSIQNELDVVVRHLNIASVLPINEEDQAMADRIIAANTPAVTSKRLLSPRRK